MSDDIKTLLCATDLGPGSDEVLARAIGLARQLGATLRVLTVIGEERETSLVEVDSHVPQDVLDRYHDDRVQRVKAQVEAQIAAHGAGRPGLDPAGMVSGIVVHEGDDVADRVLAEARTQQPDLIVVGSHGQGVLEGLLFGSAAHDLIRRTRVAVLLVPIGERDGA
jgi:nucleotide-binding universal stress UspA family protein